MKRFAAQFLSFAFIGLMAFTFMQCGGGVSAAEVEATKTDVAVQNNNTVGPTGTQPTQSIQAQQSGNPQEAVDPALATTMKFAEDAFDFGTIKQGEKVTHTFKFTNDGDKPLTITNAKGSCGCTVPQYPKEPIAPGESGEIEVEFNSAGKKGAQTKFVTLTANTNPAQTRLTIKADVVTTETK
ncbi:DUF1573 domain-containing protein [Saprospira grandis]|uniref:DUF1573 domain-containing protein n=1 Tax=Saprospira grandis (strain Lewin) TaxID=984262 RepID=H6L538_SAPGL|nr:DUF1573 domain-containing protein [Saprospira grandis]AFC22910.1 hypothetical protein SGRA_0169 [Saprospira grandis str. Lewin]